MKKKALGPVVKRAVLTGVEVIIIDDYSNDKTAEIVENNGGKIIKQNGWEEGSKRELLRMLLQINGYQISIQMNF